MKLYAATIWGHKFYFTGHLTAEATEAIEHFCVQLNPIANKSTPQKLFELLINYIESELNYSVAPVDVEHIFRVNF